MKVDSLICARWLIPVEPENDVLEEHAIAVKDDKIVDILPSEMQYRFTRLPSNTNWTIMP